MPTDAYPVPRAPVTVGDVARDLLNSQTVAVAPAPAWRVKLHSRGLTDDVIDECGFRPDGEGWRYPTPGGDADRWKAYSSTAKPKYRWVPKRSAYPYYHRPDLTDAVRDAGGDCWFVTESDLWVMLAAGVRNVVATYHETALPDGFAGWLDERGVTRLLMAPDLDDVGERNAQRVVDALRASPTDVVVFRLPDELGKRGDVTALWNLPAYNGAAFERHLLTLPQCTPDPTPAPAPAKTPAAPPLDDNDWPWLADLNPHITAALGVTGWYENGTSKPVRCPNPAHDDKHGSAFWHREKHHCVCNVCGQRWLATETADLLGLDWRAIKRQHDERNASPVATASLPNAIREALLEKKLTLVARALDALLSAGFHAGDAFSVKQLVAAGISQRTAYRVVGEQIDDANIFCQILPLQLTSIGYPDNLAKNKRGRPTTYYTVPSTSELAALLGVPTDRIFEGDELPDEATRSSKAYRVAMYRALVARRPGTYTRRWLGERLGVWGRSVRRYDDEAGVKVTPGEFVLEAELTPASLERTPDATEYGKQLVDTTGKVWPYCKRALRFALQNSKRFSGRAVVRLERQKPNSYALRESAQERPTERLEDATRKLQRVARSGGADALRDRLSGRNSVSRSHTPDLWGNAPPEQADRCPYCGGPVLLQPYAGAVCRDCNAKLSQGVA